MKRFESKDFVCSYMISVATFCSLSHHCYSSVTLNESGANEL